MSFPIESVYILTIIIIMIIGFILVKYKFFGGYVYPTVNVSTEKTTYQLNSPWAAATPVVGSEGVCQLFTFQGSEGMYPNVNYASLNNSSGIASVIPYSYTPTCVDTDQLFAQQVTHKCNTSTGPIGGTGCRKNDGTIASAGDTETYYRNCGTGKQSSSKPNPVCSGQLMNVVLNYIPTKQTGSNFSSSMCLSVPTNVTEETDANGTKIYAGAVDASVCNVGDIQQFLTVERFSIKKGAVVPDSQGKFARIAHRFSGSCLAPYIPPDINGKYKLSNVVSGTPAGLTLVDCTIDARSGVWWFLAEEASGPDPNNALKRNYAAQQILFVPDPSIADKLTATDSSAWSQYINMIAISTEGDRTVTNYKSNNTNGSYGALPAAMFVDQAFYAGYTSGNYGLNSF
jgi:hypothetical protein